MSSEPSGRAFEALLCDADGCLFPSEAPAFDASAAVTNGFLAEVGVSVRYSAEELRMTTTGQNFRTTATVLAAGGEGLDPEVLERWVEIEREAVTAHLGRVLRPDPMVSEPLARLGDTHQLAVVTSSAAPRLDACLEATALASHFPPERRFSAENSLPAPTSKPNPAIYVHALRRLRLQPQEALAIEDSVPGAMAAVRAGCPTIGNLMFVSAAERERRIADLQAVGVVDVISSWDGLELLLESVGAAESGAAR